VLSFSDKVPSVYIYILNQKPKCGSRDENFRMGYTLNIDWLIKLEIYITRGEHTGD